MSTAASERSVGFARVLRRTPTDAERRLWQLLRDRRFLAWKVRRQVPVGPYVADFLCFEARLVIEVDGGHHAENRRDAVRDRWFEAEGFRVLRLWNHEVMTTPEAALDAVFAALSVVDVAGGTARKRRAPSSAPSGHLLPRVEKGERAAPAEPKVAETVPRSPSLLPSREKVAAQRPDEGARAAHREGGVERLVIPTREQGERRASPLPVLGGEANEGVALVRSDGSRASSLLPLREKVAAQRPDEGARAAHREDRAQRPDEGARRGRSESDEGRGT